MSFSLIHTWGVGEDFTSAQANAIATTLVKALDKSIAGDTISGSIEIAATGQIEINFSAGIAVNASGGVISEIAGGIIAGTTGGIQDGGSAGGIQATVPSGISPTVAKGISDGGITGGIGATVASGINDGGTAKGITPTVATGISTRGIARGIASDVNGGISSDVPFGIQLNGGVTDYVKYVQTRTIVRTQRMHDPSNPMPTGWAQAGVQLIAPATTQVSRIPLDQIINGLLSGATLTSVTLAMQVADPHISGLPANLPSITIFRERLIGGSGPLYDNLLSTGAYTIPTPANAAAWYNSNFVQFFTFAPDQNNLINTNQYRYFAQLEDEHGANAVAGNYYLTLSLVYTLVGSSAP